MSDFYISADGPDFDNTKLLCPYFREQCKMTKCICYFTEDDASGAFIAGCNLLGQLVLENSRLAQREKALGFWSGSEEGE